MVEASHLALRAGARSIRDGALMVRQLVAVKLDDSAPTLSSLAPQYSFPSHGVYFTILKKTLDSQPDVRNIALAGTYGTGKSSILREVAKNYDERVVELSLLTLGAQPESIDPGGDTNPAATSTTNRIQKEIVKQLLYQQRPANAPESRFRRIGRFRWRPELGIAGLAGAAAIALSLVFGLDLVVTPSLAVTISDRPHVFSVVSLLLIIGLAAGTVTMLARGLVRGRVGVERVSAGPATITLPPRSVSYFDEYLDEIIYFFEINAKCDIVIIEDLDRFNDPNIFEALRSLNGLLNAAQQLGHRNFRFIYAVRDSVFEKLGQDFATAETDEARAELARANRTKFFELVVPVVPFITHKNARDLMSDLLEKRGHEISKDLVDLAARHLADMRLVHNVVNEYEVFKHRLLDVASPVPELDADRLFAMILFKNAHIGDFEKIRHGESSLDRLWETWRELVRTNIDSLRTENRNYRDRITRRSAAEEYARDIGERVRTRIDVLAAASGTGLAGKEISHSGAKVTDAQLRSPEFWRSILRSNDPLTIQTNPPAYNYGPQTMELRPPMLEILIGRSLDPTQFEEDAATHAESKIEQNDSDIALLQRHSWKQLAADAKFTYSTSGQTDPLSFRSWAEKTLPSRLAADLVINGFITSYFPLHVSSFYGKLIRPDAMTYVMRFIDHGQAEADYALDAEDVEAIIWDQGSTVLVERSMFNIGVLDHLLDKRPKDAAVVVTNIASSGAAGTEFIDRYLESGEQKPKLVAQLTPIMPGVFVYLASTPTLSALERAQLIDAAINSRASRMRYESSEELHRFIEASYGELPGLAIGAPPEAAANVVRFISSIGAVVPALTGLSKDAVASFRATRSYALTRENLELIIGSNDVSLNQLSQANEEVLAYAAASAAKYAQIFLDSDATPYSASDSTFLIKFLVLGGDAETAAVDTIVTHAGPDCRIPQLRDVPPASWPSIVRHTRSPMTFSNVAEYVDHIGEVDEDLGASLNSVSEISGAAGEEPAKRIQLALAILNSPASTLDSSHRVKLVQTLDPGLLLAEQVEPQTGQLIGDLLASDLIGDNEEAFTSRLMVDWRTQSHAMANSANFVSIVSPTTLDARFVAPLLSDAAHSELHLAVAKAFPSYPNLPREAYQAYADRALAGSYAIGAPNIKMLRAGGIGADTTISLLAKFIERMTSDELRDILRSLSKPWSKVADVGYGVTAITDSPQARTILQALQDADVVSKFPARNGYLRVSLRQKGVAAH